MASSDQRDTGRRSDTEDSGVDVPEADAAEQRISVDSQEGDDWTESASEGAFDEANEADVIEQSLEAGEDDEERR